MNLRHHRGPGKFSLIMADIDSSNRQYMSDMNRRWQHSNFSPSCIGIGSGNRTRTNLVSPSHGLSVSGTACDIMSQIHEISDGLYLSGARAIKVTKLKSLGITCIVNATIELPNLPIDNVEYVKISIEDSPYSNLGVYFDRVADKIEEVRRKNGAVLVHCVAGISRSASLCIAYLIKHKRMSLRKAYQHVKMRRQIIRPNPGFFRQLVEYENRLTGLNSVSMIYNVAAAGYIPDIYEPEYNNTLMFLNKYSDRSSDRLSSGQSGFGAGGGAKGITPLNTCLHRR